jgi:hypothetical protein
MVTGTLDKRLELFHSFRRKFWKQFPGITDEKNVADASSLIPTSWPSAVMLAAAPALAWAKEPKSILMSDSKADDRARDGESAWSHKSCSDLMPRSSPAPFKGTTQYP